MELTNEFAVPVPFERAWAVLTDVELIAPCLPGAQLTEVEGNEYRGVVKIKVGPITAQYKGTAHFEEMDVEAGRVVLVAKGRDTRGQGNADATVTATLHPAGDSTRVEVVTDLAISGKVAQFGRGVLADVSAKLLGQFVESLESSVLASHDASTPDASTPDASTPDASTPDASTPDASTNGTSPEGSSPEGGEPPPVLRTIKSAPVAPVDLLDAAGSSLAKRVVPAGAALVLLVLAYLVRRRRRR
ncbi:MAG: SRPBCC family protein [Acidimicrobiales bacterium]